jgi:hypothetical protein
MTVSSSIKHWKKYEALGCDPEFIRPLTWQKDNEDLRNYKYSLYLEDKHTHDNYAFLANRVYEALMCDVVTLFAPNTRETLKKSNLFNSLPVVLPENCYGDELIEHVNSLDFDYLRNIQKKYFDDILGERDMVLYGIREFLK